MEEKLFTRLDLPALAKPIDFRKGFLLIGSCFSNEIGNHLMQCRVPSRINPFGTLYNPYSIGECLELLSRKVQPDPSMIQARDDVYFSYQTHSDLGAYDAERVLENIEKSILNLEAWAKQPFTLILSLGTAFVYQHKGLQKYVANCHKIPGKEFSKSLLSTEEIKNSLRLGILALQKRHAIQGVIFTLSPVRHMREGLMDNQLSKSSLRLAIHQLCEEYVDWEYFPSYEIMMDELRDYRFYGPDLIHPSDQSVRIIWERFKSWAFTKEDQDILFRAYQVFQNLNHRPLFPESAAHRHFLETTLKQISSLEVEGLDFSAEKTLLEKQLIKQ